jgi:hypothetical protein
MPIKDRTRDRLAFVLAVIQGPLCILAVYLLNLVYGAAGGFFLLWCGLVLPFVIVLSRNSRFLTWQLGVVSLLVSGLAGNLGFGAFRHEMFKVVFVFWAAASLFSSPVPIYTLLRSTTPRNRIIFGCAIVLVGVALWLGVKRITG